MNINKHKLTKRVLSAIFAVSVSMSNIAVDFSNNNFTNINSIKEVSANSTVNFTLDYTKTVSSSYPQISNGVLKLNNFTFSTTATDAIIVPRGTTIEFTGTNSITSNGTGIKAVYDPDLLVMSTGWGLTIEGTSSSSKLNINAKTTGIYVQELDLDINDANIDIVAGTGITMTNSTNISYAFNMDDSKLNVNATSGNGVELKRILGTSTWEDSEITIYGKTLGLSIDGNGGDGFVDNFVIDDCTVDISTDGNSAVYLEDVNNFEVTGCKQFDLSGGNNGIQAVGAKLYFKNSYGTIKGKVNAIFSIDNPNDARRDKGNRLIEFNGGEIELIAGTSALKTDLSYDTSDEEIMFNNNVFPLVTTNSKATVKSDTSSGYTQLYNGSSIATYAVVGNTSTANVSVITYEESLDEDEKDTDTDDTEAEHEVADDTLTITFNLNYPDNSESTTFVKTTDTESVINKSDFPIVSYNGYAFLGWYLTQVDESSECISNKDSHAFQDGHTNVYARWEEVVPAYDATITFNASNGNIVTANGTTSSTTLTTNSDGKISLLPNATRDDYTFLGWFVNSQEEAITTDFIFTGDTAVYAKWQETAYITFHFNYDGQDDITRAIGTGGTVIGNFPAVNSRLDEGYSFLGWYNSDDVKVEDGATFSKTQTLTAKWSESYTITFDPVLSLLDPPTQNTNASGQLDSLPKMLCPGYGLAGWYTEKEDGELVTTSTIFDENTTIYARWISDEFTVTFKPDYTGSVEFTIATSDYKIETLPDAPSRSGYVFDGWYTKQNGEGDKLSDGYEVDEDIIVYGLWSDEIYFSGSGNDSGLDSTTGVVTVTLDAQHDSFKNLDSIETNEFGRLTKYPGILVANGMAFDGWFTGKNGTGEKIYEDTKFLSSCTIYGYWIEGEVTVTINQEYDGSFQIPYATTNNRLSTLPTPKVRPGYTFDGWYWVSNSTGSTDATIRTMSVGLASIIQSTTSSALSTAVTTTTAFTSDATIYANWSVVEGGTIIVSFDSNGGTPSYYLDQTGVDGRLAQLPNPTREGYTFLGWFDGNLEISTSYIFRFDTEVYARWQLESEYEAENAPNGSSGNSIYSRDIPTLDRLYIEQFQNLMVGDYIVGLGNVSPNRPDLGAFEGWYHGADLSRPLDYFELQSLLVTEELFATGIYPKFEKNIVSTGGTTTGGTTSTGGVATQVPVTNSIALSRLF